MTSPETRGQDEMQRRENERLRSLSQDVSETEVEAAATAIVARRGLPDGCLIRWDSFRADARAALTAAAQVRAQIERGRANVDVMREYAFQPLGIRKGE